MSLLADDASRIWNPPLVLLPPSLPFPSLPFHSLTRLAIPDRRPATCSIQNDSVRGLARHSFLFIAQMIRCQASSHLASETRIISGPPSGRAGTPQGPGQPLNLHLVHPPCHQEALGSHYSRSVPFTMCKGGWVGKGLVCGRARNVRQNYTSAKLRAVTPFGWHLSTELTR